MSRSHSIDASRNLPSSSAHAVCIAQCPSDHHAMCNMRPNHSCAWMDRTDSGQSHNLWAKPDVKPTTMIAGRKIPLRRVPPSSRITPLSLWRRGVGTWGFSQSACFWPFGRSLRICESCAAYGRSCTARDPSRCLALWFTYGCLGAQRVASSLLSQGDGRQSRDSPR